MKQKKQSFQIRPTESCFGPITLYRQSGKGMHTETKELAERKAQTEADLKEDQTTQAEAKESMVKATALREKEATALTKQMADSDAHIAALGKAIT